MVVIYHIIVYVSIIFTLVYYGLVAYLGKLYGICKIAFLFEDPTDLGIDFFLEFAKFSLVLNILIILPVGLILTIIAIWKKYIHRDTVILFLINFFSFILTIFICVLDFRVGYLIDGVCRRL